MPQKFNNHKSPPPGQRPQDRGGGQRGLRDDRFARHESELSEQDIQKLLAGDGETIVNQASNLAKQIQSLKATQLRNFYGSVLLIEEKVRCGGLSRAEFVNKIQLLRPKLHYMVNRPQGNAALALQRYLDRLIPAAVKKINELETQNQSEGWRKVAEAFFDFIEAVVAYHKG